MRQPDRGGARPGFRSDPHPEQPRRMAFSTNMHRLRVQAGITQEVLAEATGLCVNSVGKLERGDIQPRHETAILIADALSFHLCRYVSLDEMSDRKAAI